MAKGHQQNTVQNITSFRIMDLAILIFSLIFVIDLVLYFVLDGSLRDFVVMMFSMFMVIVTLTARLRFQPDIGRQIILEWVAVSIIGIILSVYFAFIFSL